MANILLMEDDNAIRLAIARMLRTGGHCVTDYPDALPALQEADFTSIDLIITNLTMPTPGEKAIRLIRSRGIQTSIIVISAFLTPERTEKLLKMGAQEAVEKPFLLSKFLNLVQKWLPEHTHTPA